MGGHLNDAVGPLDDHGIVSWAQAAGRPKQLQLGITGKPYKFAWFVVGLLAVFRVFWFTCSICCCMGEGGRGWDPGPQFHLAGLPNKIPEMEPEMEISRGYPPPPIPCLTPWGFSWAQAAARQKLLQATTQIALNWRIEFVVWRLGGG